MARRLYRLRPVPDVMPRTDTPVWMGLITFAFELEETLVSMRPGEQHVVLHRDRLCASVSAELPPVRSTEFR